MFNVKGKILNVMKNLLSCILLCAVVLCSTNVAYMKGDSPKIIKSGELSNLAKDMPILTVRLDYSKFTKDNATLTYAMNQRYYNDKFEWDKISDNLDCIVIKDLTIPNTLYGNNGIMSPGSFTLTFKDAAIMRDGTTKDFQATYEPTIFIKKNMDSYEDSFTILTLSSSKPGITVNPLSKERIHFGLRLKITCRVVGDNLDGETFLFAADEINNARAGIFFESIVSAADNNNFSEAIQLNSGVDGESDIYLPNNSTLNTNPADTTGKNGYDVKFIATGSNDNNNIAAAAKASGIAVRAWSSAGTNPVPINLYVLDPGNFTNEHISSSGAGGKIELWTDGQTHDTDTQENAFKKLDGGTLAKPHTYAVPKGKEVTYRMTPNEGYIIDKLHVNGNEVNATNTIYKTNSAEIAYYEYHFDDSTVDN
ncbi:MAG: hypothetical protein IJR47_01195, partial [Clostridia bacterium]|nr:hypothetical protein [Clostridia bacterium]